MNDMRNKSKSWMDRADELTHQLKNDIFKECLAGGLPQTAFHYCRAEAMYSILTKEVWLSDLAFMNDPGEGVLIDELLKHIDAKIAAKKDGYNENSLISCLRVHLDINAAHILKVDTSAPKNYFAFRYVLSLAEQRDSLNLWRFYGDDGHGYSVEMDLVALNKTISDLLLKLEASDSKNKTAIRPIEIRRVTYLKSEDLRDLAKKIVDEIEQDSCINKHAEDDPTDGVNMLAWNISNRIYEMAYFIKHKDWEAEHEVRAMVSGYGNWADDVYEQCRSHHISGKYLVPHIQVPTKEKSQIVKSVTAGPCLNNTEYVKRSFKQLVAPKGMRYRERTFLRFSECYYRR